MTQKIDMSPDAVTGRMVALDQLWELSVALRSSKIVEEAREQDGTDTDPSDIAGVEDEMRDP